MTLGGDTVYFIIIYGLFLSTFSNLINMPKSEPKRKPYMNLIMLTIDKQIDTHVYIIILYDIIKVLWTLLSLYLRRHGIIIYCILNFNDIILDVLNRKLTLQRGSLVFILQYSSNISTSLINVFPDFPYELWKYWNYISQYVKSDKLEPQQHTTADTSLVPHHKYLVAQTVNLSRIYHLEFCLITV